MPDAFHHLHKRKRAYKKMETYPHPNFLKNFFDKLVYGVSIMVPAVTFIQVWKIWETKNADGISTITFGGYIIGNIVWVIYGGIHKEMPIIVMYGLLLILNGMIMAGAFLF